MTVTALWNLLMKHLKQLYMLLVNTVRKHVYLSLLAGVLTIALLGSVLAVASKDAPPIDAPKKVGSTLAVSNVTDENPGNQAVAEQTSNSPTAGQAAAAGTKPKTQTPSPAPAPANSQKSLKISPSSFTAKPGDSLSITIQANDGRAINMPMFSSGSTGKAMLNFGGSPAKSMWSGQVIVSKNVAPGTYTMEISAQDSKAAYYRSTITITIVQPTMTVAIQSLGYDEEDDSLGYVVKISRLYGFSEPVTDVIDSATDPEFGCDSDMSDSNTIDLTCFHFAGERPTNGTLTITVKTASVTRTVTAPYSLPPL